ncbi:MAG: biotin--[acetyl-CoA-carboxylase] ligase [Flavobacteriales bacterium]|nr:biotin--[acetyl-CoA-carboxylase] ligase [Flavobacteriales bacterium]
MSPKIGHEIVYLETVDSTNSYLLGLVDGDELEEGYIVIAHKQLKGKGQRMNSWKSESGKNLTLSLYLKPNLKIENHFDLNKIISIAVVELLKQFISDEISIKWPNDIYIEDKKVGGILIESRIVGKSVTSSVIGIGLNVNQLKFDASLPNPTSIKLISGVTNNMDECLSKLCACLERKYKMLHTVSSSEIDKRYKALLYRLNEFHEYDVLGKVEFAKIVGVDDLGRLVLLTKFDQLIECNMKEVAYKI